MLQQTVRRIPLKGFLFRRPPDIGGPICCSGAFKLTGTPCEPRDDTSSRLFLLICAGSMTASIVMTRSGHAALGCLAQQRFCNMGLG